MDLYQVAEIELVYKRVGKTSDRPQIKKAEDAHKLLSDHWDENKLDFIEQFKILLLNRANRVIGISDLSTGGITSTVVDPRIILVTALKANATSIILAHNHPSANLKPSDADRYLTQRLTDAGKLLDIEVLDHIIVTSEGFYSFAEKCAYEKVFRSGTFFYEVAMPF
jgi:DNA repair protein RadC